jgi:hypothetical protein
MKDPPIIDKMAVANMTDFQHAPHFGNRRFGRQFVGDGTRAHSHNRSAYPLAGTVEFKSATVQRGGSPLASKIVRPRRRRHWRKNPVVVMAACFITQLRQAPQNSSTILPVATISILVVTATAMTMPWWRELLLDTQK